MTDLRKAAEMALEALEDYRFASGFERPLAQDAIDELRQALEQPEQEPVAWLSTDCIGERYLWFSKPIDKDSAQPLYTAPPKREWVGLTDDEAWGCWNWEDFNETWKKMEAKLKEKNR